MPKAIVIGAGYMGQSHVRILRSFPDVDVVGVAELNTDRRRAIGRMYGVRTFRSHQEALVETAPDFGIIASPTSTHGTIARELILRKLSVFIEKPIAKTIREGRRIVELSRRHHVPIMVGHVERFNPVVVELKRRIDQGMLGKMFHLRADRLGPFPGRISDVGVVIDLSTHDIDISQYLLNDYITSVQAETHTFFQARHENFLLGILRFKKGVTGVLNVNWITPTKIRRLQVFGERGMFEVNYLTQELFFYENNTEMIPWHQMVVLKGMSEGDMTKIRIVQKEPLEAELRAFIDALQSHQRLMPMNPEEALRSLEVAHALLRSGKTGRSVRIRHE